MALRFPPVAQFVARFRALLSRRTRFDFDAEVAAFGRLEQAVAFLALLELRKSGEIALAQAAPLAPIRVARSAPSGRVDTGQESLTRPERDAPWTVHSA